MSLVSHNDDSLFLPKRPSFTSEVKTRVFRDQFLHNMTRCIVEHLFSAFSLQKAATIHFKYALPSTYVAANFLFVFVSTYMLKSQIL